MNYLTNQLIDDIVRGGLIIAPCNSGKTTAINYVLKHYEDFVLLSDAAEYKKWIYPKLSYKIFSDVSLIDDYKKIIIDEAFRFPELFNIKFHSALTEAAIPVILYNANGDKMSLKPATLYNGD